MYEGKSGWALILALLASSAWALLSAGDLTGFLRFRLAVSEGMISAAVNGGDAKAAMEAWRDAVFKQSSFFVDVHVSPLAKLRDEVRDHSVDAYTLTTVEFAMLENYAAPQLILDDTNAKGGEEFLLLVNEDGGFHNLADLRHKVLNVLDSPRTAIGLIWLDNQLYSSKLSGAQEFFSSVTPQNKLARVVLPVYFRQADACVVTRRGFNTMCEMNPQLGRKLKILATSQKLMTSLMAFHKDCSASTRERCVNSLEGLHKSAAGQQALTLFESTHLITADISCVRGTLDLIKEHEKSKSRSAAIKR